MAQTLDLLFPTPNGIRRLGDIELNEDIFGCDGHIAKVIGLCPQKESDVYRVTFDDGSNTVCTGNHLFYFTQDENNYIVDTLANTRKYSDIKFPINKPVDFIEQELPVDSEKLANFLTGKSKILGSNHFEDLLKLPKTEYYIPEQYKINSKKVRYDFLQYMLATGVPEVGDELIVYFDNPSQRLIDDLVFIIRSLGIYVKQEGNLLEVHENIKYRTIKDITGIGKAETSFVFVNSKDRLYLANDFIVTR